MKKTTVYCLELDGTKAIYFTLEDLLTSIKMETENYEDEDLLAIKFTVSFIDMTEKEIEEIPEFDGF